MAMEYLSFEKVLKELQLEEAELKRLVSAGDIPAFQGKKGSLAFKPSHIKAFKEGKIPGDDFVLLGAPGSGEAGDHEIVIMEGGEQVDPYAQVYEQDSGGFMVSSELTQPIGEQDLSFLQDQESACDCKDCSNRQDCPRCEEDSK